MLVLIGADASGRKELLAIEDGFRESAQSWRELLRRLRDQNGLVLNPELATGDGALGFWQALHEVWPKTKQQRCWVHKAANVLNRLPASLQGKPKQDLHAIYEAENRQDAEKAFDHFIAKYGLKDDKAAACLTKDRDSLLACYDFPAKHWKHVRTATPSRAPSPPSGYAPTRPWRYRRRRSPPGPGSAGLPNSSAQTSKPSHPLGPMQPRSVNHVLAFL